MSRYDLWDQLHALRTYTCPYRKPNTTGQGARIDRYSLRWAIFAGWSGVAWSDSSRREPLRTARRGMREVCQALAWKRFCSWPN